LRSVSLQLSGSVTGQLAFENTNPTSMNAPSYNVGIFISGTHPAGSFNPGPNPAFEYAPDVFHQILLSAFDGTIDFVGPSATTIPFQNAFGTGVPVMDYPLFGDAQMAPWIGPAGAPGTVAFTLQNADISGPFLPPGVLESHTMTTNVHLSVRYEFDLLPTPICLALPSSGCPCSNPGSNGGGCANSLNAQGGLLAINGAASLSNDTLHLLGSRMPDSNALYFQGTAYVFVQAPFGDGLRCVFGSIRRLGTKTNVGGASSYPVGADPSISVRGGVTTPGTRYYQTFYRNSASYCTSATFNTTNGYAILWQP
jgi:hypothetical protein